ncbi:MAG: Gfo/Idh/MocA family protein [Candidatus Geothermincolia bacterium]
MGADPDKSGEETGLSVIGLGHWGPHYVRIFSQLPGCKVVSCCDVNRDRVREIADAFPNVRVTTDPDEVFASSDTSAVVVATPASTHFDVAMKCIESGKDLLVEKPLALTSAHCATLVEAAKESGAVLMVGHTFIYNAGVRKIKDIADAGDLGRIYYLLFTRTHLGLIREDVSAIWDLAPHDISIASYVLGKRPEGVSAVGSAFLKDGRQDVAFVNIFYPDDVVANIHVSWIDSNKERRVTVVGSDRRVVFDDLNNLETVKIFEKGVSVEKPVSNFGEFRLLLRDGDIISPKIEPSEPLKNMCRHFLDCLVTREDPITDGASGFQTVKVIEAIEQSLARKGCYVPIEW